MCTGSVRSSQSISIFSSLFFFFFSFNTMVFLLPPLQRAIFVIKVVFLNLCIWISQQPNPTSGSCLYMQQIHPHPFYIIVVKQESLSELLSTPLIFMTGKWESWDPQWDMLSHCLFYELIRWEHSLRVSLSEAAMLQRFRKKKKKVNKFPKHIQAHRFHISNFHECWVPGFPNLSYLYWNNWNELEWKTGWKAHRS